MRRRLAAALALALLWSPPTFAADGEEEARRHFEVGQRHYNVGDFDGAIDEFKRAYEISPAPGLLFNIAQAYRAKKQGDKALYFYTTYLREDPNASERPYVEARIEELRASEQSQRAIVAAAAEQRHADENRGRGLKIAGVAVAGGGLALVGTAAVFAVKAAQASSEISDVFQHGGTWGPHEEDVWSSGQRYQTASWVLGAAGVAAMATGGVLYYMGTKDRPVTVGAQASAGGGSVAVRCAF